MNKQPVFRWAQMGCVVLNLLVAGFFGVAAQPASDVTAQQEALREITLAAGSFLRGAPVPAWADLLPLPQQPSKNSNRPIVVRLADTHLRAGPQPAFLVNRAEQVTDPTQLGQIGQTQIQFNPAFQRLLMHRIALIRLGQTVDHTSTAQVRFLQRETGLEQGIYNGVITANIVLPDVRAGDTLHLIYTIDGENPIFGHRYSNSAGWEQSRPIDVRRVTLSAPESSPMQWRWVGGLSTSQVRPSIGTREGWRQWRFEQRDIAPVDLEDNMPANAQPHRWLQFSEYGQWSEVVRWAQGLLPEEQSLSPELVGLVQRLKALPTPQEKVSQALQWVQGEIRYWSVALGESSHRPASPAVVVSRRWGDCKDKSVLLVHLLREVGIDAYPVLVSLRTRSAALHLLPSPHAFDHMVVRVPLDGRDHWLDPTQVVQASNLDRLGQHLEATAVLPVQPGVKALVEIVSPQREKLFLTDITERFSITALSGEGHLRFEQILVGLAAENLRSMLKQMDDAQRRDLVIGRYERRYPGIVLEGSPRFDDEVRSNKMVLSANFHIPKLVNTTADGWSMRYFPRSFVGSFELPDRLGGRKFPLVIPSWPSRMSYQIEISWPESVAVVTDPRVQRLEAKHFDLDSQSSFRGNIFRKHMVLQPKISAVPAGEVAQLVEDIGKMDPLVGGLVFVDKASIKNTGFLGLGKSTLKDQLIKRQLQLINVSSKAIASGRLTGEDLAEALCTRAEAQADVDQAGKGLPDAIEAVKTAPQFSRAWQCRGNLYFATGEFAKAAGDYAKALSLGHDAFESLYRRGHARFYEGKLELAASDFTKAVAEKEDASDRLFAQLWQTWTLQRLGQPLPPDLLASGRMQERANWPQPALAMLQGHLSIDQLLQWVDRNKRGDERELTLVEAWFYIGQRQWIDGQRDDARQSFERAREKGVTVFIEHVAAGWELRAKIPP